MDLVMKVCSTIHVLDFGTILAVGTRPRSRATGGAGAYLGSHAAAVATQ